MTGNLFFVPAPVMFLENVAEELGKFLLVTLI